MSDTQYGLYFAKAGTDERHHRTKGWHPIDLPRMRREARWILEDFKEQRGSSYRLHSGWADRLELWEFPPGAHDFLTYPDRLIAEAVLGSDDDLSPVGGFDLPEAAE